MSNLGVLKELIGSKVSKGAFLNESVVNVTFVGFYKLSIGSKLNKGSNYFGES